MCSEAVMKHDCTEFTWPPVSGVSTSRPTGVTRGVSGGPTQGGGASGVPTSPDGGGGGGTEESVVTVTVPTSLTTVPTTNDRTFHIKVSA